MAIKMMSFLVLVFIIVSVTFWENVTSQTDCTNVLISMSPCLNYIQGNTSTPSSSCCSQLANVVKSSPICLCQVLNNGGSLGININQTQALALPSACKVQTPPQSQCNSSSTPSGSPSADSPLGSESKNTPSTNDGDSSDAEYSTKFTIPSIFFALVVVVATFSII